MHSLVVSLCYDVLLLYIMIMAMYMAMHDGIEALLPLPIAYARPLGLGLIPLL